MASIFARYAFQDTDPGVIIKKHFKDPKSPKCAVVYEVDGKFHFKVLPKARHFRNVPASPAYPSLKDAINAVAAKIPMDKFVTVEA